METVYNVQGRGSQGETQIKKPKYSRFISAIQLDSNCEFHSILNICLITCYIFIHLVDSGRYGKVFLFFAFFDKLTRPCTNCMTQA